MLPFTLARPGYGPALALLLALAAPLRVLAQKRAPVSGTIAIANGTGTAVEYATVTLHRASDSVVVKTEFSNGQGAFLLEAPSGTRYRVSAAQVGFARYWSPAFELPAAGLALSPFSLVASQTSALKEVTVRGRKPPFEHLADRTVVNVADSPLSAGATALDVLGRAPGVTVDAGDNLGLRGRQGLLVVIDGKRVPLSGSELADYLRALPAEQLQSIELIANPPAQYDAQGGAGVIAINLKRDQRQGTNGSVNASYGRGEYGKFAGGGALNYRRKKLNVYGNYAYSDRQGFTRLDFNRQFFAAPSQLATEQLSHLRSHTGKVGLELTFSKRTVLGVALTGLTSQTDNRTANQTQLFGPAGEPTSRYSSVALQDLRRPSGSASLNFRHSFADSATARSLSADADFARYGTTRLLALTTRYETPAQPSNLLSGDQRNALTIQSVKADFGQPLSHRARLEAGVKLTRIQSNNIVAFANTVEGITTFNELISKPFQYHENINAAYLSLRGAAPKTTFQAGLRAEQTNTLAELSGATPNEQHYTQLFPSATVQRTLSERHALGLSVARRIDRPSYGQVNPLRTYLDGTSYSSGNPDLRAQTSYNIELSHTYRQKFSTALIYAQTTQPIVNVVQPAPGPDQLVVNRNVNLTAQQFYSLTLTAPLELTKWWTMYANGVFFYARFVGTVAGTALDRGRTACTLTANSSFVMPHGWSADLNGVYESREAFGFELIRPRGQVAAGLQKNFWGKQGTFRLNVADIFYTAPVRSASTYDNFSESFFRQQDTRVATAALTYRFGRSQVAAARKRAAGAEEELRRAAGQ